jgi:hypothetical protein
LFSACNEEWKEEQYEKTVSFVKSGYTEVYLKYRSEGGVAPYQIPLLVSGSTKNDENVEVTVAVDPDTLAAMNYGRFRDREDLYFRLLEAKFYDLKSSTVTIPAGAETGLLSVDFKLQDLDMVEKYILPLQITATSTYAPSPRKWYKKTMMRIVPFNDYSGPYQATSGEIAFAGGSVGVEPRETRVVNENTVFFYAGFVDEKARDRATYKIRMQFNPDSTLTLTADSSGLISFTQNMSDPATNRYEIISNFDPTTPYLEHRYTIISLSYTFTDISNPSYTVRYTVKGRMTMQRTRNTLVPEEDQQFIFD